MKLSTKKAGRPSKLTPEVSGHLLQAIKTGHYYESACAYAGIDYTTFRNWMRQGEKQEKGEYFNFFNAVRRAEAEAEIKMVELWREQMPRDWKAARDFLERRFPERWGKRERVELTGNEGGPVEIEEVRKMLIEKLCALNEEENSIT